MNIAKIILFILYIQFLQNDKTPASINSGDAELAERYAELARNADSYNAAAFVNLANVWYGRGDVEKAR